MGAGKGKTRRMQFAQDYRYRGITNILTEQITPRAIDKVIENYIPRNGWESLEAREKGHLFQYHDTDG